MVSEIKNLIKELPFENVKKELDSLEKKLETKELNVVVVGEFNAGKSSLINSLYNINLPVNDRPETATIWEIVLGEKEEIVVYFKNNETKLASIEEIKELNPKDIAYIKYFINSKEDEVVLVDTPGLSSLDEFHKEALKNYIEKADVILVILDIAQGLTQSTISFLEENKENTQKLYAILTKADTLPENEQEKQLSYIKDKFPVFQKVIKVSKNDVSSLKELLKNIAANKEEIISNRVNEKAKQICKNLISMIEDNIKLKQSSSEEELINEMNKIYSDIEKTQTAIMNKKIEFEDSLSNLIKQIQDEFKNSLSSKIDWIVEALYDKNLAESIDDRFKIAIQESLNESMKILENEIKKTLSIMPSINENISDRWFVQASDKMVYAREALINSITLLAHKIPHLEKFLPYIMDSLRDIIDFVLKNATKSFVKKEVAGLIDTISADINIKIYTEIKNSSDELFKEISKELIAQKEDYEKMLEEIKSKLDTAADEKENELKKLKNIQNQLKNICKE